MKTYLVGGGVRDKMLGAEPKDHDWVIVGATASDVEQLLADGYSQVGADFPVFLHPHTGDEYALARVERKMGVGYHGFVVEADSSVTIEADLARRDLTINSMAIGEDGVLIDPYHGLKDLRNKILRHTTDAFAEDPLRVLRLARFAARYSTFSICPATITLCQQICESGELNHLSVERIWVEMEKGFQETSPLRFMQVLNETKALEHCELLQRLFGSRLSDAQIKEAKALVSVHADARLAVGVAVLAVKFLKSTDLRGISKRVLDCYQNVHTLTYSKYEVHDLMHVLKSAGALRAGPTFSDLIQACTVMEQVGDRRLRFQPRQLMQGQRLLKEVRAAEFPGLEGRALGAAIEEKRAENLQMAMAIPNIDNQRQVS